MAGQSGHQLWLAGIGGRVHQPDIKAVRHSREHQPACVDCRIHGVNPDTDAHSDANGNIYSDNNTHTYAHANAYTFFTCVALPACYHGSGRLGKHQ